MEGPITKKKEIEFEKNYGFAPLPSYLIGYCGNKEK